MIKRYTAFDSSILRLIAVMRNCTRLVLAFFAKISLQQETVILTYHSVASNCDFYGVDPDAFRQQMDYLRKNYSIFSLAEISNLIKTKGKMPKKSVSITFDDGYHDFYINAYPYFKKYRLPATVFVATKYVGQTWPFSKNNSRILLWKEIAEIARNNIEIGAHTVTHTNLQEKRPEETKYELIASKKEIERHLNREVGFFSYPFGRYTWQTIAAVKDCGFEGAVGGRGSVQKSLSLFALKRVQIDSSLSFLQFVASLTKAVDWLRIIEGSFKSMFRKRWK